MFSAYHIREELEDELYHDGDSEVSEVDSEMEFHLYGQLHYSSNAAEMEEQGDDEEKENNSLGLANQQHEMLGTTGNGGSNLLLKNDSKHSSSNDSLQRNKKKKKVKKQKNKKKIDSKDQRLSSLCCEEVIVIDSSTDVISISDESSDDDDDDDDDVGVCSLKGQGSLKLLTSTPAQQETQNRKRSSIVPVTVVSCSSVDSESTLESESSESDSSDSDSLENWMLLGQGMQDGDQSISLNLKGGSFSSADVEGGQTWLVSEKDKEAQIYNKGSGPRIIVQRGSNRYYNKSVHCRNCNKTGHISKNCSESKKLLTCYLCGTTGHVASQCPNKHCYNCGQPGHRYDSCREKACWYKQCHRCSKKGHFIDACPEIWRQYHITTKSGPPVKQQKKNKDQSIVYCFNCSKKGHFGFACTYKKMFIGVYPSSPFISHYDTVQDIKQRQHRTYRKVNEMRKSGHFPTPHTSKPSKKTQKISHHTNNHQPNKTTFQTPNTHKPRPSHIIFTDSDFVNSTRKKKSFTQQQPVGSVKPWKPKRPVPTSRDPLPSKKQALDEDDSLPRGGPHLNKMQNKGKKKKKKKTEQVSLFQAEMHKGKKSDLFCRTVEGGMPKRTSKNQKGEKRQNWKEFNNKKFGAQHEEDNLFSIKQRKRKKRNPFI